MDSAEVEHLIGTSASDPGVHAFLSRIDEVPKKDNFAEMSIVEYTKTGLAVYFDAQRQVASMFFHGTEDENHGRYRGRLPGNLSFEDTRIDVARKLGVSNMSGVGKTSRAPWERFDGESYSVHVEYSTDRDGIEMGSPSGSLSRSPSPPAAEATSPALGPRRASH